MIVTDSLGIGGDKRAKEFGDEGANTLLHVSETNLLKIPMWKKLGITSAAQIHNSGKIKDQLAYTARIQEISNAKDTLAGHWEMMGIFTEIPFPTFTETGFPKELIDLLSEAFDGRKIIGNRSASGTEIIDELAHEETENGSIIVYTSEDSVLQICANENVIGLENLYKYAKAARKICSSKPEWNVGRIIARPYIVQDGKYVRTFNRHDYANLPPKKTVLQKLVDKNIKTISIGKINDIFVGQGVLEHHHSNGDADGMDIAINLATKKTEKELIFVNLVEFDSHYGHRRNVEGYAENINLLDIKLSKLINAMNDDDLLILTSDHGNDPTFPGSGHTREQLPATIYSKSFKGRPKFLGELNSLATLGNIIAKNFEVEISEIGEDIWDKII